MKNFVLKDINPEKVLSFEAFLKEMNDFVGLISVLSGPYVSAKNLVKSENNVKLELNENDFSVLFDGDLENGIPTKGDFQLKQQAKKLLHVKYTIGKVKPYAMQIILDCDSESIVKTEFEKVFHRTISYESEQFIKEVPENRVIEEEQSEPGNHTFEENEALINAEDKNDIHIQEASNTAEKEETNVEFESQDEVVEEIEKLSEKVLDSIHQMDELLNELQAICHDITRGASGEFSKAEISKHALENGATIEMINTTENGYQVSFRKGMLENDAEISFFLERDDEIVFSVYLSSAGIGRLTSTSNRAEMIIEKVKNQLGLTNKL